MYILKQAYKAIHLKNEVSLLFKKKYKVLGILNPLTMFLPHSELSQSNYTKKESFNNFLSLFKMSNNMMKEPIKRIGNKKSDVVFINGICSSVEIAQYQASVLSEMLNKDVELIYNKTDGLLMDLLECVQDRIYNDISKAAIETAKIILEKISTNENVIVVGYSQGTIISSKAIEILNEVLTDDLKKRVKLFNFASACKSFSGEGIHTEHFINASDPVCHLGYIEHKDEISGDSFYKDSSGHLLVADYLNPIKLFKNINDSEFKKLIF